MNTSNSVVSSDYFKSSYIDVCVHAYICAYKHAKRSQSHRLKQKIWKKHFLIKSEYMSKPKSKTTVHNAPGENTCQSKGKIILITALCLICHKMEKKLSDKKTLCHNLTSNYIVNIP